MKKFLILSVFMSLAVFASAQQLSLRIGPLKQIHASITTGTQHQVLLTWTETTPGTTFNVYRGTSPSGENATPLNGSPVLGQTYTDSVVQNGTTYYYYVTAVSGKNESAGSNEVSAVIPTNPAPPVLAPAQSQ